MGLSFDSAKLRRQANTLSQRQKAFKRYLLRDMEKLAKVMERLARAMAPMESGSLEKAIYAKVENSFSEVKIQLYVSGAKQRIGHPGVTVGDYADYINNGHYKLGKLSRMKSVTNPPIDGMQARVGRLFMERAIEMGHKNFGNIVLEAACKAGFTGG
jgi:hypothetical protein